MGEALNCFFLFQLIDLSLLKSVDCEEREGRVS